MLMPEIDAADVDQALGEEAGRRPAAPSTARSAPSPASRGTARRPCAPAGCPAWPLSVETQIGPRAVQRREEAEQQAGADRQRRGEQQHRAVDRELQRLGGVVGQQRDDQRRASSATTSRPARPPSTASTHATRSAAGRSSCRRLAPIDSRTAISPSAPRAARQQQVGDVRAGDQQHEAGDAEQQHAAASRLRRRPMLWPRAPGSSQHLLGLEPRHRLLAHALLQRRLDVVDDARGTAR